MFSQSGIPVIYSGDEVGRLNDYTYHSDPDKQADSRYIHRGAFQWGLAEYRNDPDAYQGKAHTASICRFSREASPVARVCQVVAMVVTL